MIKTIFSTSYTGSRQQRPWLINVVDTQYTGDPAADPIELGPIDVNGAIIKWGNDRDLYEPMIASTCDIILHLSGAAKIWATETLPLTQEFRYFLDIYDNNQLFWRGVIITDGIQFYDMPEPLEFKLRAICGLGRLQELDYQRVIEAIGEPNQSGQLLGEVLRCLKFATVEPDLFSTSVPFLRTNFQWYETNMDTTVGGIDPLQLVSFNVANIAFTINNDGERDYISIYDYLRQILTNFGLCITFANGAWQLFQPNQLMGTSTSVRYFEYPVNYGAKLNPNQNTGTIINSNLFTNVQKNVSNVISKSNLLPLAGILNSYKAPFNEISTEPTFDFSLVVYRNPAIDLSVALISENYNLSGSFGFRVNIATDVLLSGVSLPSPIIVRVDGQFRLSITDGSQTRYLTSTGAWVAGVTSFSMGFDTDQLLNGQQRTFTLTTLLDSDPLPFAGVVSFQTINVNATQVPVGTNQNALIVSKISDITIEHYDTTGNGSIRSEFYTVTNLSPSVQSSVSALLRLPLFDRATRYQQNSIFIWDETTSQRVHSQLWRKNNVGAFFTIHILVLREALLRRQTPAKIKEGTYIGFVAPHEKVKDEGANWAVVNSEFSTGYDQMTRLQMQNLGVDVFSVDPLPSERTVLTPTGGVLTGGGRIGNQPNTLTYLGQKLEPISVGVITSITLPVATTFQITAGTTLTILDAVTNLPVTIVTSEDSDSGATSLNIESVTIQQPIISPYLFYPLLTIIN
jgi:hypothetical protein